MMLGRDFLLQRPDGHRLTVYTTGAIDAPAVLLLHGGPGGGAANDHARYFDLSCTRLIQFDQRGTGRSQFDDPLLGNTTADQIADIEAIRDAIGVTTWTVAGGSWGALLAVLYAEAHPEAIRRLILRNVFLDRASDRAWLLRHNGPAPRTRQRLFDLIGATENPFTVLDSRAGAAHDLKSARLEACWRHYERVLSGLANDADAAPPLTPRQLLDVRVELHYLAHDFFVADDQAATSAASLSGIPGLVLQGDEDGVISPDSAEHLTALWRGAEVRRVPGGGHSLQCAAMSLAWQQALHEPASLSHTGSLR